MRSIFISLSRCAPVPFDFAFGFAQEDKEMGFPFSALLRETKRWKDERRVYVMDKKFYVYILTNTGQTVLYIGVTNDLPRRIGEHKASLIEGFTKRYKVWKLIYFEEFGDIKYAIAREKQLKGWVRVKKENLIKSVNPSWRELSPI